MTRPAKGGFSVSAPGLDREGYQSGPVAISAAISLATAADDETTIYVRYPDGEPYGRVERDPGRRGTIRIYAPQTRIRSS